MSAIDDVLAHLPLDEIAAQTGASPDQVRTAAQAAVPALLGGMHANAQHTGGAASLAQALAQHDGSLLDQLDAGAGLDRVDTTEGAKIAAHVFGGSEEAVVHQLGAVSAQGGGGGSDLVKKLIPILAPIVMSYLAKQVSGKTGAGSGGSVVGDVLGQVLGGGSGSGGAGGLGGTLGDVLGGLLGRGRTT